MAENALAELKDALKHVPNWDLLVKNHQGKIAHVELTFKARSDAEVRRLTQMVRSTTNDQEMG